MEPPTNVFKNVKNFTGHLNIPFSHRRGQHKVFFLVFQKPYHAYIAARLEIVTFCSVF